MNDSISKGEIIHAVNAEVNKPKKVRYKLHTPIEEVVIEFDEKEEVTSIDHILSDSFNWLKPVHKAVAKEYIESVPSADIPTEDYSDLPDIPRAYYEKIVGNMSHEINMLKEQLESADAVQGEWIPCGEKMPNELERVNVTWLNHNPPFYYQHIKDIPQTDTAVYYRGKWYWWDATVIDVLAEYGEDCNAEQIDKDIEVVAWMPLPKPYKGGDEE